VAGGGRTGCVPGAGLTLISGALPADLGGVTLDPNAALSASLAMAVCWTMVFASARKRTIRLRGAQRRKCPSCGHRISGRVCERH
jgi:hypothetical protein